MEPRPQPRPRAATRRAWLGADEFLDLVGLTNLIPGPDSTEMAMALGYRRTGWPGLLAGGGGVHRAGRMVVLLGLGAGALWRGIG